MTAPLAGLPMYDWPEVADAVDELWHHVAAAADRRGLVVPARLSRPDDLTTLWRDPHMILGQVCSLNPVRDGLGETEVVGTLVYEQPGGLIDMEPGSYASVIICRADDPRRPAGLGLGVGLATDAIERFRGATVAANGTDSQSGYWSLGHFVREVSDVPVFGPVTFTGAHRDSILAVADGAVDLAAIDIHSWRLATEHEPAATAEVAVIGVTDPTPGVVCVVSWELAHHRVTLQQALADAVERFVVTPAAQRLHIVGFRPRRLEEFQIVADQVDEAQRRTWHR